MNSEGEKTVAKFHGDERIEGECSSEAQEANGTIGDPRLLVTSTHPDGPCKSNHKLSK